MADVVFPPEREPSPISGVTGRLRHGERGTALVEFALVAPILFLLVFGIVDFARALNYYNTLTQLAGQGARAAAVNRNPDGSSLVTSDSIQQQIANSTGTKEFRKGIKVCIIFPNRTAPQPGEPVEVKTSFDFKFIPFIGNAVKALGGVLKLSATSTERDEVPPLDSNGRATYAAVDQFGRACS